MLLEDVQWAAPAVTPPAFDLVTADVIASMEAQFRDSTSELHAPFDSEPIDRHLSLRVTGKRISQLTSLNVHMTQRAERSGLVELYGADPSGSLRVLISVHTGSNQLACRMRFEAPATVEPIELSVVVDWIRSLRDGEFLELWSQDETSALAAAPLRSFARTELPAGFAETIGLLSRYQQVTSRALPVPNHLDEGDVRRLQQVVALLTGQAIEETWSNATLIVDDRTSQFLAEPGPGGFRLEVVDVQAGLPGTSREIPVLRTFAQANVTSIVPLGDQWVVHLKPGSSRRASARQLKVEDIDLCMGRWIAERDGVVVAIGDQPTAVAEQLRMTDEFGAIWRVPTTRQEAESDWA